MDGMKIFTMKMQKDVELMNKLEVGMYAYSKSCRDYGIGKIVSITENGQGLKGI